MLLKRRSADPAAWGPATADGNGLRWTRRVRVGSGEGGRPPRVAVRALERLRTDRDVSPVGTGIRRPNPEVLTVPDRSDTGFMTRIVYADAVRL